MSKQTDNKQFWQRWASCYGPLMQSSEPLYAAIAQQMQSHLTPEMNVLELACGSGQLSFRLSRLVRDWEATDFSPKMIAQAKLKPRGAGLQIYNSWMVPQYLAFLQAGGFAVQEHALLGDTLAPLCYARAVPDKTRVTQR